MGGLISHIHIVTPTVLLRDRIVTQTIDEAYPQIVDHRHERGLITGLRIIVEEGIVLEGVVFGIGQTDSGGKFQIE